MKPFRLKHHTPIVGAILSLLVSLSLAGCGAAGTSSAGSSASSSYLPPQTPKPNEVDFPTPLPPQKPVQLTPVPTGSDPSFDNGPSAIYVPNTPVPAAPHHVRISIFHMPDAKRSALLASVIVEGITTKIDSARWSTVDQKRPANPWAADNQYGIFRPVTVQVTSTLKGSSIPSEVLINVSTGVVGQDSVESNDDFYHYEVGDHVILFLTQTTPEGMQEVNGRPLWRVLEHYTINAQGQAVAAGHAVSVSQIHQDVQQVTGK